MCSFTHPSDITCYLNGYYPTVNFFFHLHNVRLNPINDFEWKNTDGTKGSSITVTTLVGDERYTCVASGLPDTEARSTTAYVRAVSNITAEVVPPQSSEIYAAIGKCLSGNPLRQNAQKYKNSSVYTNVIFSAYVE